MAGERIPALLLQLYCNPVGPELQHASERRFHRIDGTILHVGQDVGVDVEGDGYGGVAEHLGDHLHVDTLSQEQGGTGMPEVVETQILPDAGALLYAPKGAVAQV